MPVGDVTLEGVQKQVFTGVILEKYCRIVILKNFKIKIPMMELALLTKLLYHWCSPANL